ncbi:hypothetical protein LJC55_02530 [Eubacteriales bacterium OttesenSCG-928-N14]|nr:hypothetical protein [Eubacteriales bacterium OttesenSCG-928-N14]
MKRVAVLLSCFTLLLCFGCSAEKKAVYPFENMLDPFGYFQEKILLSPLSDFEAKHGAEFHYIANEVAYRKTYVEDTLSVNTSIYSHPLYDAVIGVETEYYIRGRVDSTFFFELSDHIIQLFVEQFGEENLRIRFRTKAEYALSEMPSLEAFWNAFFTGGGDGYIEPMHPIDGIYYRISIDDGIYGTHSIKIQQYNEQLWQRDKYTAPEGHYWWQPVDNRTSEFQSAYPDWKPTYTEEGYVFSQQRSTESGETYLYEVLATRRKVYAALLTYQFETLAALQKAMPYLFSEYLPAGGHYELYKNREYNRMQHHIHTLPNMLTQEFDIIEIFFRDNFDGMLANEYLTILRKNDRYYVICTYASKDIVNALPTP